MNDCSAFRELLVLHAEGELDPDQVPRLAAHLAECAGCSGELERIQQLRVWLRDPELLSPPQTEAWVSLPSACSRNAVRPRRFQLVRFPLRWALPLAAGLVLAAGLMYVLRRPDVTLEQAAMPAPPGNEAFLGRIDTAVTMKATTQYLAQCQDLLVDMLNVGRTCAGKRYDVSFEVKRARDLLRRKQILDTELSAPEVAPARDLCDDLENLLVDLSLSQSCETPDKFRSIEKVIESERLLLRIKLVQSEITAE